MKILICTKCNKERELNEFSFKTKKNDKKRRICKYCHSEYRKLHYLNNKEKIKNQVDTYRKNNPEKYLKEKLTTKKVLGDECYFVPKHSSYSRKGGRVIEMQCNVCYSIVYGTKKDLTNNKNKFCSKNCSKIKIKSPYYHYLKRVEKRSLKTSRDFNLTEEFLKNLLEEKQKNLCALTNIPIKIDGTGNSILYETASLDRIDSSKGYIKDNVQWVVIGVNYMKLDYSIQEIHETLRLIKENYIPV